MPTISRATIKSYDAATHSAAVQIAGSLAVWLDAVPVSDGIAPADVVAGRECGVIFFTDDNPNDAAVVTIHNAVPTGWASVPHLVRDADANTYVDVEHSANEDKVRMAVGGTERYVLQTASPHHTLTGDVKIATGGVAVGLGGSQTVQAGTIMYLRNKNATVNDSIGLLVDVGLVYGDPTGTGQVVGIAGNALVKENTSLLCYGLNFTAGVNVGSATTTVNSIFNAKLQLITFTGANTTVTEMGFLDTAYGGGAIKEVTTFYGARFNDAGGSGYNIKTVYGVYVAPQTLGSLKTYPFYDGGVSDATGIAGNVFRTNTQFASTTLAFGGGDGVIGLHYAATNPTANPANGVVIYARSSSGHVEVRGAGGAIVKLPTGGATNVTGSRGGNAALANLMTALAALGLVVDGTT